MSDRIWVGTRKGLFSLQRAPGAAGQWSVAAPLFPGDPVNMVLADARDGALYAALDLGHFGVKLHRSDNGGTTWKEIGVPVYPAVPASSDTTTAAAAAPTLELIWSLQGAGPDQPGALWAGTIPGGLFRS
jgi:ligand-binding sensor domain-containing protein